MAAYRKPKSIHDFVIGSPKGNPLIYLDIAVGNEPIRRLHFELFHDDCPLTSKNFRLLCTGEMVSTTESSFWYRGTSIHRVIPDFMMQGGDLTHGNGLGGTSSLGRPFEDENFSYKHRVGSLSMAHQDNTNKSQFFICFVEAKWLDCRHVVFGQLVKEDLALLAGIEAQGTPSGRTKMDIKVNDSGQLAGVNLPQSKEIHLRKQVHEMGVKTEKDHENEAKVGY